ncbi:hypothetical protein HPP92_017247 [Vanilla planifolia]|uniref:Uncharacterized protein n=1 Tax=Vanilla planifolia TaxID=51239 RepID=A0A835ULS1_VANPL|nr:hypothetical protein HPP92_017247 [Vanilla planifolia]
MEIILLKSLKSSLVGPIRMATTKTFELFENIIEVISQTGRVSIIQVESNIIHSSSNNDSSLKNRLH